MQKLKPLNFSGLLLIIRSCLLGIVATLLGVVLLAVVLKFVDFSANIITWFNNGIKTISMFVAMLSIKRKSGDKLLFKSIFAGTIYAILSFVVFSILNGDFNFNLSFIYDLMFAVIVSMIASIVLNLLGKKTV